MIGAIKSVLVSAIGIGGVGAGLYGIISATSSKEQWKKELLVSGPAIECDDDFAKYEFFLKLADKTEEEIGLGLTFQVQKTTKEGNKQRQILWGSKVTGENNWGDWRMTFTNKEINGIWTKDPGMTIYHALYMVHGCKEKGLKIQLKDPLKNQGDDDGNGIEGTSIRFEIDESTCKRETNTKECDIKFSSANNLEWKNGFKPRIKYTLISN